MNKAVETPLLNKEGTYQNDKLETTSSANNHTSWQNVLNYLDARGATAEGEHQNAELVPPRQSRTRRSTKKKIC